MDANIFPVQEADIVIARRRNQIKLLRRRERTGPDRRRIFLLDASPLELSLSPGGDEASTHAEYHDPNHRHRDLRHFRIRKRRFLCGRDDGSIQGIRLRLFRCPDESTRTVTISGSHPPNLLGVIILPKSAESEIKRLYEQRDSFLNTRVGRPSRTIVVHDGVPTNASAGQLLCPISGIIIKNVALHEIYGDPGPCAPHHDRRECAAINVLSR